jgi:hypothetical protein
MSQKADKYHTPPVPYWRIGSGSGSGYYYFPHLQSEMVPIDKIRPLAKELQTYLEAIGWKVVIPEAGTDRCEFNIYNGVVIYIGQLESHIIPGSGYQVTLPDGSTETECEYKSRIVYQKYKIHSDSYYEKTFFSPVNQVANPTPSTKCYYCPKKLTDIEAVLKILRPDIAVCSGFPTHDIPGKAD